MLTESVLFVYIICHFFPFCVDCFLVQNNSLPVFCIKEWMAQELVMGPWTFSPKLSSALV